MFRKVMTPQDGYRTEIYVREPVSGLTVIKVTEKSMSVTVAKPGGSGKVSLEVVQMVEFLTCFFPRW